MLNQTTYPNCGIVIMHVFLSKFFQNLGLLEGEKIKNRNAQIKAIQLLHYLSTATNHFAEQSDITIFKVLVNLPQQEHIAFKEQLTAIEIGECKFLFQSFINHWSAVKKTSINEIQRLFIQKRGIIIEKEQSIEIYLEKSPIDFLLDQLPYNYHILKLPWIKNLFSVII